MADLPFMIFFPHACACIVYADIMELERNGYYDMIFTNYVLCPINSGGTS